MSIQLLIAQIILFLLGTLGVATASPELTKDHLGKVLLGMLITFVVARIPVSFWLRHGTKIWGMTLGLLLMVLFFGVGTETSRGTRRWLSLAGVRFQPSEWAKLALVMQLASFFSRRGIQDKLVSATLMIIATTGLILAEPDLGTGMLTFILGVTVMFAAGVHIGNVALFFFGTLALAMPLASVYLEKNPYILNRWLGHWNRQENALVGLDQVGMAHRDLELGGWWGHGPDGLRWNYFAAHTDMVVASVGFSSGLLGVTMILFAYSLIITTSLQVAQMAAKIRPLSSEVHGAMVLATGCMFMVVGQAILNLGVAVGVFPVTGVTLPLVSYGLSSIVAMSAALGIIHSCMRTVREQLPEESLRLDLVQPFEKAE